MTDLRFKFGFIGCGNMGSALAMSIARSYQGSAVALCDSDNAKALDLAERFIDELFNSTIFFLEYYDLAQKEFESCYNCISYVADLTEHFGDEEFANSIRNRFNSLLDIEE